MSQDDFAPQEFYDDGEGEGEGGGEYEYDDEEGYRSPGALEADPDAGGAATSGSTLVQRAPQLDEPQRIHPPAYMKAPERSAVATREQLIHATAFSPAAHRRKYDAAHYAAAHAPAPELPESPTRGGAAASPERRAAKSVKPKRPVNLKKHQENHAPFETAAQDYAMLAFSCRRAGRLDMEGVAYFSLGVLGDNRMQLRSAIDAYKRFVHVCKKRGDAVTEALGYNAIGVDYQLLARPADASSSFDGELTPQRRRFLEKAVQYHRLHCETADEAGQFVAHSNLGLTFGSLGDFVRAARHHQDALRLAIRLQSLQGQSFAVGNLGLLAAQQGDLVTAKACMDQHLQLVQSLRDFPAETHAWTQLGLLANSEGNFEDASRYFDQARRVAQQTSQMATLKRANCNVGIARGNLKLRQYMEGLAAGLGC